MENKEFTYSGFRINGFVMLFLNLLLTFGAIGLIVFGIMTGPWPFVAGVVLLIISLIFWGGFMMLEPNEARVVMFFGKYRGTFATPGYHWINPFTNTKKLSLRARNLDAEPIKVNDKIGNPVMIGLVLVWKLKNTYKAMFEIDAQTMAQASRAGNANEVGSTSMVKIMDALENFVKVQSDAALRQVAGQYAYDDTDGGDKEITLRDGSDEINKELEHKLDERLDMAGIEVVEARINYLA